MRYLCPVVFGALLALVGCGETFSPGGGGGGGGGGGFHAGGDGGPGGGGDGGTPVSCTPSCAGRTCGDDGCGGICGACAADALCQAGACAPLSGAPMLVDATADPHPIHPEIYGLAFASTKTLTALRVPVNRWGGNTSTLYNWKLDVNNLGNDWYFENVPNNAGQDPSAAGYLSASDQFVLGNRGQGAQTLMTIPTIGWAPKDRVVNHPYTCGFPVTLYPGQQKFDPYDANCGNGLNSAGQPITGMATNDSVAEPPSFAGDWLAHLTSTFGTSQSGGIRYYALDNEMNLWNSTHADVHPMPVSFDEVWQKTLDYAPLIRAADPGAVILGYGSWGVLDLFDSALDQTNKEADRAAHGNTPLAAWYLGQLAAYQKAHGTRLVDCLDVHYYPQGGDPLENTRSLWDATYHDPSWIDQWLMEPIALLPRVAAWIATQYPGTGLCITEYNFYNGDPTNADAALVEAEVLGLFGRYAVRLANFWSTPVDDQGNPQPAFYGMKLLRNYDGSGGAFGETSVGAATTLSGVSVFGALRASDGALTVLVVNKAASALSTNLTLAHFNAATAAHAWSYTEGAGATITAGADLPIANGVLKVSLPAKSMMILVVPHS